MLIDVAVGGTMMAFDVEQATIIIDALASTDYKAQHDRQGLQNKGSLEDALLAKNKILTQQIEQLTAQMAPNNYMLFIHLKARVNQSGAIFVEVIILMVTVLLRTIHMKLRIHPCLKE